MHDVVSLMRTSKEALAEMFDRFTVAEWIEQKLYPMYRYLTTITINIIYIKTITIITILNIIFLMHSRLSKLRQTADGLRGVSVWPSRFLKQIKFKEYKYTLNSLFFQQQSTLQALRTTGGVKGPGDRSGANNGVEV